MKLFVIACFVFLYAFSNAASNSISLNGKWKFFASNDVTENEVLANYNINWDTITVPGNWDTREKYSTHVGKGYYQRNFEVPANWNEKQIRIHFGAVYQTSKVWINGHLLGEHVGGYTPFEYNLTRFVEFGKTNSILVMADNSYKRGAWWAWGGISRNVSLMSNENVRLVYQHISAIPDFDHQMVYFSLKYKIENIGCKSEKIKINTHIDGHGFAKKVSSKFQISAQTTISKEISFAEELQAFKLWHFNHPNLYQLESHLRVNGRKWDEKTDQFGIRKLEVKGEQMFLNNESVRMNGLNRVHDHPKYGNSEPDHLIDSDMSDIKSLGCNFARLMHAPLSENLLNWCDKNGFLLIEEIPIWGDDDPNSFPNNPQTKQWLKEMIERDYNHPSVVAWSVGNELRDSIPAWGKKTLTTQQREYIITMLDYIDKIDTTRLKTYVSLTANSTTANAQNEPIHKIDFICLNSYGNSAKAAKSAHENFPGKPIFMSEVGRTQIGPSPNGRFCDDLVEYMNQLKKMPYVIGISYWCYNDYKSNYKGTPQSGFREWGVVDHNRNKKKAYQQLKEIYSNWNKE